MFGGLLDGPESLEAVSVAFVVDLPVEEVPWRARSAALLTRQRFGDLTDVGPPNRERYLGQLRVERNASRRHLHHVLDRYHDREWQRAHRSYTMYPEDHLWWAADALVELDDAIRDELVDRD